MNPGFVRVTPELIAAALFPGANVKAIRICETREDLYEGTVTLLLQSDQFVRVPDGVMAPMYEAITTTANGVITTTFRFPGRASAA